MRTAIRGAPPRCLISFGSIESEGVCWDWLLETPWAPLEGLSAQQIKTHYGRVRNYVDGVQAWKCKPHRWRLRGLYSDDTQQALALCEVLLDCRRIDQERLADLYLALMTPKGSFQTVPPRHRPHFSPGAFGLDAAYPRI